MRRDRLVASASIVAAATTILLSRRGLLAMWRDDSPTESAIPARGRPRPEARSAPRRSGAEPTGGGPTVARLPNVLLVGAQKAGSTALSEWLFRSGVCRPRTFGGSEYFRKEVHFFDVDARYGGGGRFYANRFRHCDRDSLAMDATPSYLPFPQRVRQVYDEAGGRQAENVKILVILREPVARELSLYNHMAEKARNSKPNHRNWWRKVVNSDGTLMSFGEYVQKWTLPTVTAPDWPCLRQRPVAQCYGLYVYFLQQWLTLFSHKQVLVLTYDELVKDEEMLLLRVKTFLHLGEVLGRENITKENENDSAYKVVLPPCQIQTKLAKAFEQANKDLYELLEQKTGPEIEQHPFPRFILSNCTSSKDEKTQ